MALALACAIALLLAASLLGQVSKYKLGHDHVLGLVWLFNVDGERNVPTWYSAVALLASSLLLGVIGFLHRQEGDRFAAHWLGLSFVFLYASADEAASIHELLDPILHQRLSLPRFLQFAWVVVGIPVVLLLGVAYFRFLANLPRRFLRWFVAAAAIYLSGAVGVELAGSIYSAAFGIDNLGFSLITTVEEGLEMAGVAMFIYALLEYVAERFGTVCVRIQDRPRP